MKRVILVRILPVIVALLGIVFFFITRDAGIREDADFNSQIAFACSLIAALVGIAALIFSFVPKGRKTDIRTLTAAALFAALSYVGFAVFKIDIPVGTEKTAFHLGNVFCVLGALFLGGFWGGMAGAVGMTIADLTANYVTSAPKTFLLKLCIGLITGAIAHGIFKLSHDRQRKVSLPLAATISCIGGMAFNVIADPVVGYFYKRYVFGVPQDVAKIWAKIGAMTTLVNALIATVAAAVLYLASRTALKKAGLLPHID